MTATQFTNHWTGTMIHTEHVYQKEYRILRERSYETLLQCCKTNDVEGFRNTINDLQFRNGEIIMECVPKLRKLGYNINKSNQLNVVKTQGGNNMFTDEERNDAIDQVADSVKDQQIRKLEQQLEQKNRQLKIVVQRKLEDPKFLNRLFKDPEYRDRLSEIPWICDLALAVTVDEKSSIEISSKNKDGIPIGTRLQRVYYGDEYALIVQEDGYRREDTGDLYTSLSGAGKSVTCNRVSGWEFWRTEDGETVNDAFRK